MNAILVSWHNRQDHQIIWEFSPGWTWDDFHKALATTQQMGVEVGQSVDIILLIKKNALTPTGSSALVHIRHAMRVATDQGGIVVMVGDNAFARMLVKIFVRAYHNTSQKFFVTDTVDEASRIINHSHRKSN